MKGFFKNSSFGGQLFLFLLVFVFCFLSGIILGIVFSNATIPELSLLKILTLIQSVFSFLLPPFILAYLWSEKPLNYLYLNTKTDWRSCFLVVLMMIIAIPCINLLTDLNQRISFPEFMSGMEEQMKSMEEQASAQTEKLLSAHTLTGLFFNIFLIAVIPALGEELFFRGTLQRILQDSRNTILAIWVTAFVFSAIHMQFYGFIPRLLLGAFFGYLLVWSKNIWLPILAHFINNAFSVVYYYLSNNGYRVVDMDTIGTGDTWWLGLFSGIVFMSLFFILKKRFKEKVRF